VAQVVLENVYKSFLRHQSRQASFVAAGALVSPVEEALAETPTTASMVNVLRRINLEVKDGEFMVLVGPSGCGKSTLLRLIAGLEQVTGGNIWVGDRQVNDLPPKQRDIAMVFQNYALYPHMTVYDNLAFGLRRTKTVHSSATSQTLNAEAQTNRFAWTEKILTTLTRPLPKQLRYWSRQEREIDRRIRTVAQILQIEPLLDRLPKQLSGGQKQRVALGRAMARNPQVFLMDEPLSNLDAKLRTETRAQIVNLQRKLGTTTIYVTHDQVEAMTMGDRIAVMNAGQIQQIAAPLELYNRPANRFVAEFIGSPQMNFLPVQVKAPLLITHPQFRLTLPQIWETALGQYDGRSLTLGIRPEHLSLSVAAPKNVPVRVERLEALGNETQLVLNLIESATPSEPTILRARVEPDRRVSLGEELWLAIATDKIHLFDAETGEAIAHH
jgi:multiple sugar transport system ATP-binding protein